MGRRRGYSGDSAEEEEDFSNDEGDMEDEEDEQTEEEESERGFGNQRPRRSDRSDALEVPGLRGLLESYLTSDLDFQSSFAFTRTYAESPIPSLSISGLGTIGLPLSDREAKQVIKKCVQAPFGKGERTVVDKKVRDTWEMDASKVAFQNPGWSNFMARVVDDVCDTLGVDVNTSKPRAELYKLLVYETGSHFLPHVDTEKANGMFATIIVVLPTKFTGGDAYLSHSGHSTVFNTSSASLSKTSVLAWYTDVTHEIKPITSGYRVALSYNLVHTESSIRPSLSSVSLETIGALRRILQIWKDTAPGDKDSETGERAPEKVLYELEHKYSQVNLSATALKGRDSHLVALLEPLARELGFCLGLANIHLTLSGTPDDEYGRPSRLEFDDIHDTSTEIKNLVDLEGNVLANDIKVEESEVIPHDLLEELRHKPCDQEDYEGHSGNEAGSLDRLYRRSALVIWPPITQLGVGCGDRRASYAFGVLAAPSDSLPTEQEGELFDYLCQTALHLDLDLVVPSLGFASRHWNDIERWIQATESLGGGVNEACFIEEVDRAISKFGFSKLAPCLTTALFNDEYNVSRFGFLTSLEGLSQRPGFTASKTQVATFTAKARLDLLKNIGEPSMDEIDLLTNEALKAGGVQKLQKLLIPRVIVMASPEFLKGYAARLFQLLPTFGRQPKNLAVLRKCISEILIAAVTREDPLKVTMQKDHSGWYGNTQLTHKDYQNTGGKVLSFIKLCLHCENPDIAASVVNRMIDLDGLNESEVMLRAMNIIVPLLPLLKQEAEARDPQPELSLQKVHQRAVQLCLKHLEATWSSGYSRTDISQLLDTATLFGSGEMLTSLIYPSVKKFPWVEHGWRCFIEELSSRRSKPPYDAQTVDGILKHMAMRFAGNVNIAGSENGSTSWKDVLSFCMRTGGAPCLSIVVSRALQPGLTAKYVSGSLVPLVSGLREISGAHNISLTSEPFARAIQATLDAWIAHFLEPKPDDAAARPLLARLTHWDCGCGNCVSTRQMLTESSARMENLYRIGAPRRKHVEKMLEQYASGAAVWEQKMTSPQGLVVYKANVLVPISTWRAKQKQTLEIFNCIGTENAAAIWGQRYPVLVHYLNNGKPKPPRPAQQNSGPPAFPPPQIIPVKRRAA